MTRAAQAPPGWPPPVRPAGAPDWESSAVAWLLDVCPPDYRRYEVFTRHPIVLALAAGAHLRAGVLASRELMATLRAEVGDGLEPPALAAALDACDREGRRLAAALRGAELVTSALRGTRFRARL